MTKKTIKKTLSYCGALTVLFAVAISAVKGNGLEVYLNGTLVFHSIGEVFE